MSHGTNPEIPQAPNANIQPEHQQEQLKENLLALMKSGEELPDEYIHNATPKTLQDALEQGLVECIEKGEWLSKKYTELTSRETWSSIKANHQAEIQRGFALRIQKGGDFPRALSDLATKETWEYIKNNHQEAVQQGIAAYAARREGVLDIHLKLLNDDAVQKNILKDLAAGTCHSDRFIKLLSEKGADDIREKHQPEVVSGIALGLKSGVAVPSKYLELVTGDNLQAALTQWIPAEIGQGRGIPKKYLDSASKGVLDTIKANNQREIGGRIGDCVRDGKNLPTYLKNLATDETMQTALKYGFVHYMWSGAVIPEYYLKLAAPETMQSALRETLLGYIKSGGHMSPTYTAKITPESYAIVQRDHQADIQKGLVRQIGSGTVTIPHYFAKLAAPETMQSALEESFMNSLRLGSVIADTYLAQLPPVFYENVKTKHQTDLQLWLVQRMEHRENMPAGYAQLATAETKRSAFQQAQQTFINRFVHSLKSGEMMTSAQEASIAPASYEIIKKQHQPALQQALARHVQLNQGWPIAYARLATKETVQAALQEAFVGYVTNNQRIPVEYLDKATDKTLEAALTAAFFEILRKGSDLSQTYINHFFKEGRLQQYAENVLRKAAQEGRHLPTKKHPELISNGVLATFENESVIREAAYHLTSSFFASPKEMESEIRELLSQKDSDWLRRLVFDRTLLSAGIKIHTAKQELGSTLKKTGGFVAHGRDTCFVSNPVPNTFVLEIALEALKKKIPGLYEEAFFQTCVPNRLNNECCGIATIGFLLTKTNNVKYDPSILRHNQRTTGLTIYDARGRLEEKFYVPKAIDDDKKVTFDGRTDIVLCTTLEDIKKAHMLLSLLVHASYEPQELRFRALGKKFVSEFKAMLERRGHADWLQHNFINANVDDVGKILLEIGEHREEVSKVITQYNAGVGLYSEEPESEDAEGIRKQLESMKKAIDSSFWFEVRTLIERYENLLYPDGMYIHELTRDYY